MTNITRGRAKGAKALLISLGYVACSLAWVSVAHAQCAIVYSDRASFTTAATSRQTIDFNNVSGVDDFSFTINGVFFWALSGVKNVPSAAFPPYEGPGQILLLRSTTHGLGGGGFKLPPGTTAVGFDLHNFATPPEVRFTVTYSSGAGAVVTKNIPRQGFIGLTSDTPIDQIGISRLVSGDMGIDNVTFGQRQVGGPPVLLTEEDTGRAVALDSVTFVRGPFPVFTPHNLSADRLTRLTLFAAGTELTPGEGSLAVTAQAEDDRQGSIPLQVEGVSKVPGQGCLTQVTVKLPAALATAN